MEISRVGKSVATAATLARAIQEVDTDLLGGLCHECFHAPLRQTATVPFLAEKHGIGAWRFMGRRLRWHQPSGPAQYDPLGPLAWSMVLDLLPARGGERPAPALPISKNRKTVGPRSAAPPLGPLRANLTFCFWPRYKLRRGTILPGAPENTSQAVEFFPGLVRPLPRSTAPPRILEPSH